MSRTAAAKRGEFFEISLKNIEFCKFGSLFCKFVTLLLKNIFRRGSIASIE